MSRLCVVVGCGPGMGGSVAVKFAKEGFAIAGMCRTESSYAPTAALLTEMKAKHKYVMWCERCNTSSRLSCTNIVK